MTSETTLALLQALCAMNLPIEDEMSKIIPDDIQEAAEKVAHELYLTTDGAFLDVDGVMTIAHAIMAERQRCLDICAAEREWGDFHPDDVMGRVTRGEAARVIPGWNAPSED